VEVAAAVCVKASGVVRMVSEGRSCQMREVRMQVLPSGTRVLESAEVLKLRTAVETILLQGDGVEGVAEAK